MAKAIFKKHLIGVMLRGLESMMVRRTHGGGDNWHLPSPTASRRQSTLGMASSETSKPAPSGTFVPTRSHLIFPKQFCQLETKYSNMSLWAVLMQATTVVSCVCCLFLLVFSFNSFICTDPGIGHFVSLVIEVHWVWICKLVFLLY